MPEPTPDPILSYLEPWQRNLLLALLTRMHALWPLPADPFDPSAWLTPDPTPGVEGSESPRL